MHAFQLSDHQTEPAWTDLPVPYPAPGEVLLRILACGLNFADLLTIKGTYQERPGLPFTLGMEPVGIVEAVGPGVLSPTIGARVMAIGGHGGLAEFGCFAAARCVPLPAQMPFETAAAFPIAYGTSHLALGHRAALQAGETLVVLGAAGGVGLTAVEIGKALGARVIAVARGAAKLAVAQAAGADHLIDSDTSDLKASLRALGGVDVVYDAVGGEAFGAALGATRPEGRLLVIGFASGTVPPVPANLLLVKNLTVIGFYWGGYLSFRPEVLTKSLATLLGWYEQGRLHPHVSHILPRDQAAEGLRMLRNRTSTGKVVVRMTEP